MKQSGKGGARPGAGRPPGAPNKSKKQDCKMPYCTSLHPRFVKWLRQQKKASRLIEQALDETFDIPKEDNFWKFVLSK